jgi:hypothetical protein
VFERRQARTVLHGGRRWRCAPRAQAESLQEVALAAPMAVRTEIERRLPRRSTRSRIAASSARKSVACTQRDFQACVVLFKRWFRCKRCLSIVVPHKHSFTVPRGWCFELRPRTNALLPIYASFVPDSTTAMLNEQGTAHRGTLSSVLSRWSYYPCNAGKPVNYLKCLAIQSTSKPAISPSMRDTTNAINGRREV